MYSLSYIIHIVGVAIWIGSFISFGYLLKGLVNNRENITNFAPVIKGIQKWVMGGVLPSLALILFSGVYMILQFNRASLPLYLTVMEQGGSLIILLTMIMVSIYSTRITKKLKGLPLKKEKTLAEVTKIYGNFLLISTLLGIGIVIVVGLRLV